MQKLAEPFDVNKEYFNFDNVKMSEARPPLTAHFDGFSLPIELDEPFNYTDTVTASILNPSEVRKQFEAELIDVNDPHTPVFAPYYASTAGNGKLYQNDGGRNTSEI